MNARALARLRSLITLAVLVVVVLVAAAWGWAKLTTPFPQAEEVPVCEDVTVAAGEPITPEELVVNVVNAGDRVGLAASTMNALETRGFARGSASDAADGTEVATVEIWSSDPRRPRRPTGLHLPRQAGLGRRPHGLRARHHDRGRRQVQGRGQGPQADRAPAGDDDLRADRARDADLLAHRRLRADVPVSPPASGPAGPGR